MPRANRTPPSTGSLTDLLVQVARSDVPVPSYGPQGLFPRRSAAAESALDQLVPSLLAEAEGGLVLTRRGIDDLMRHATGAQRLERMGAVAPRYREPMREAFEARATPTERRQLDARGPASAEAEPSDGLLAAQALGDDLATNAAVVPSPAFAGKQALSPYARQRLMTAFEEAGARFVHVGVTDWGPSQRPTVDLSATSRPALVRSLGRHLTRLRAMVQPVRGASSVVKAQRKADRRSLRASTDPGGHPQALGAVTDALERLGATAATPRGFAVPADPSLHALPKAVDPGDAVVVLAPAWAFEGEVVTKAHVAPAGQVHPVSLGDDPTQRVPRQTVYRPLGGHYAVHEAFAPENGHKHYVLTFVPAGLAVTRTRGASTLAPLKALADHLAKHVPRDPSVVFGEVPAQPTLRAIAAAMATFPRIAEVVTSERLGEVTTLAAPTPTSPAPAVRAPEPGPKSEPRSVVTILDEFRGCLGQPAGQEWAEARRQLAVVSVPALDTALQQHGLATTGRRASKIDRLLNAVFRQALRAIHEANHAVQSGASTKGAPPSSPAPAVPSVTPERPTPGSGAPPAAAPPRKGRGHPIGTLRPRKGGRVALKVSETDWQIYRSRRAAERAKATFDETGQAPSPRRRKRGSKGRRRDTKLSGGPILVAAAAHRELSRPGPVPGPVREGWHWIGHGPHNTEVRTTWGGRHGNYAVHRDPGGTYVVSHVPTGSEIRAFGPRSPTPATLAKKLAAFLHRFVGEAGASATFGNPGSFPPDERAAVRAALTDFEHEEGLRPSSMSKPSR